MNSQFLFWTKHFFCVFAFLAFACNQSAAQSETSSYEVPVDARSISMGQSFVAVHKNPHALLYNPAALSGLGGVSFSYSQRSINWFDSFTKDFKYHAVNASVATPFAVFGFSYNRLSLGEFTRTNSSGVEIGRFSPHEHTFTLGASHSFENGLAVGASIKTYNFVEIPVTNASNPDGIGDVQKTLPILFDLGTIYQCSNEYSENASGNFALGFALQNFGSNFVIKDSAGHQTSSNQLNRYFRIGAAYSITVLESETELTPFTGTVSLEYRKLLNGFSKAQSDYYGFGIEARIFEIVSARLGGYLSNIRWIYGEPKTVAVRYGFGLNIPFTKIGVAMPFGLKVDYAAIPVNNPNRNVSDTINSPLNSFTITLQYENELF